MVKADEWMSLASFAVEKWSFESVSNALGNDSAMEAISRS